MPSQQFVNTKRALAELGKLIPKMPDTIRNNMIDVALELHEDIVVLSPVDTGWWRLNNQVQFNQVGTETVGSKDSVSPNSAEQESLNNAQRNMSLPIGEIRSIVLYNPLPYSQKLEHGSSKQAPQGVYNQAAQVAEAFFRRAMKEDGLI